MRVLCCHSSDHFAYFLQQQKNYTEICQSLWLINVSKMVACKYFKFYFKFKNLSWFPGFVKKLVYKHVINGETHKYSILQQQQKTLLTGFNKKNIRKLGGRLNTAGNY